MRAAYLDASALVKLLRREPESAALRRALEDVPAWVSSELVDVELHCTARRLGGGPLLDRVDEIVAGIHLVPFDAGMRARATGAAFDPPLRALDAVHLATALSIREELDAFVAYDRDLMAAARASAMTVRAPSEAHE